jgi:hypothetical protein
VFGLAVSRHGAYLIVGFTGVFLGANRPRLFKRNLERSFSVQEILFVHKAAEIGGALDGRPRHSNIPRIASGEWIVKSAQILGFSAYLA